MQNRDMAVDFVEGESEREMHTYQWSHARARGPDRHTYLIIHRGRTNVEWWPGERFTLWNVARNVTNNSGSQPTLLEFRPYAYRVARTRRCVLRFQFFLLATLSRGAQFARGSNRTKREKETR